MISAHTVRLCGTVGALRGSDVPADGVSLARLTDMTRGLFTGLATCSGASARRPCRCLRLGLVPFSRLLPVLQLLQRRPCRALLCPKLLRNGYDKGLATGTIAASGTLGSLIPPSVLLILYGVSMRRFPLDSCSLAGFIPGILSALIYMAMIVVRVKANPGLAGDVVVEVTEEEKRTIVREIWPLPLLILAVLGGIFSGAFSPTEAGALGAFIAADYCLHPRKADKRGPF